MPTEPAPFPLHQWQRDPRNPIFPPGKAGSDTRRCMTPNVLRQGDQYFLFYGGEADDGHVRICLATAPVDDLTCWTRHGALFDVGAPGKFDAFWCTMPRIHRFGEKWYLYYTGRNPEFGQGLQEFGGVGLAVSDDLFHWERYSEDPVLTGDGFPQWPHSHGIGGGGSIIELPQEDGRILYRRFFTVLPGTKNPDVFIDQEKHAAIADSWDGIHWFNKRVTMSRRPEADYENIAVSCVQPFRTPKGWWGIYTPIGTRFGFYSICEARSQDGIHWDRGEPGQNISLAPQGDGWESQMVSYTALIDEGDKLRLFYCGNGYGTTGIGMATAEKIDGGNYERIVVKQ